MAIVIAIVLGIAIVIVVAIDLETNLVLTFVPITSPNMLMKNIIQTWDMMMKSVITNIRFDEICHLEMESKVTFVSEGNFSRF